MRHNQLKASEPNSTAARDRGHTPCESPIDRGNQQERERERERERDRTTKSMEEETEKIGVRQSERTSEGAGNSKGLWNKINKMICLYFWHSH